MTEFRCNEPRSVHPVRMRRLLALTALTLLGACSLLLQDGVRSRSVYCSTSRAYYITDLALGGIYTYVAATRIPEKQAVVFAPSALFLGSGVLGIYKRHNCVDWREKAPQAEWDRMASVVAAEQQAAAEQAARDQAAREEAQRQAAAQYAAMLEQQAQQQVIDQQNQPAPAPEPEPAQPVYRPPPSGGGNVTINIERHASTDEIGKSCDPSAGYSGGGDPDKAWPHAGSCQYGAVCYHRRCTVWCGNDRSCPNGMRCAMTTGTAPTELCQ